MSRRITGVLTAPDGAPLALAEVEVAALRTEEGAVIKGALSTFTTAADGRYDKTLVDGYYSVRIAQGGVLQHVGCVWVEDGADISLNELLLRDYHLGDPVAGRIESLTQEARAAADRSFMEHQGSAGERVLAEQAAEQATAQAGSVAQLALAPLAGMIGRISNPMVHMPLVDSLQGNYRGELNYTRASAATYVDRYGVLRTAAIDEPRFEVEGLLVEGSRTNFIVDSAEFDSSGWNRSGISAQKDAVLAPDGSLSADKLVEGTNDSSHFASQYFLPEAGQAYTFSFFYKRGERHLKVRFTLGFDGAAEVQIDTLQHIHVGKTSGAEVKIKPLAGDWFRVEFTAVAGSAPSSTQAQVYLIRDLAGVNAYTGDGSSGAYIWGAQLEKGEFASSYISTTAVPVTRGSDFLRLPFAGNHPDLIRRNSQFSYVVTGDRAGVSGYSRGLFGVYSPSSFSYSMIRNNSGTDELRYYRDGVGIRTGGLVLVQDDEPFRVAVTVQGDSAAIYQGGEFAESRLMQPAVVESNPEYLGIGISNTASNWFGHIRDLRIYDVALTAGEVALL
ncbi:LamG-like jellyroll fold domain-containing protein (plasmid) [Microbulbifer sp. ANSA001]|uniref:phage head spike fiber domain-containing protein n=1 Tax=Microbulbifer sp. ANSA001 TaxID=3243358 RepID=UPI004041635B